MPIKTLKDFLEHHSHPTVDDAVRHLQSHVLSDLEFDVEEIRQQYLNILDGMDNSLISCELDRWHSNLQPFAKQMLRVQTGFSPLLEKVLSLRLSFRENLIATYGHEREELSKAVEIAEQYFDNFLLAGARVYESESKRRIKEADLRHTSFFENMVFPAFLADARGIMLHVNPEMKRFLADKIEEPVVSQHISDVLSALHVEEEQIGVYLNQLNDDERVQRLPLHAIDSEGESLFFEISSTFRFNADGEPVGIQGFLQDVTQRHLSGIRLREQQRLLQTVFDNAPIGLMAVDEAGAIQYLNGMFLRNLMVPDEMFDSLRKDMVGLSFESAFEDILECCDCHGESFEQLRRFIKPQPDVREIEITLTAEQHVLFLTAPLLQAAEEVRGLVVLSQDVSHERKLERLRDDLTHMIVHDLKNPLSAIQAAHATLQLILKDSDKSTDRVLKVIDRSVGNMTRMVGNLLDVSRLEQEKLPLKLKSIDPGDLLVEMRPDLQSMGEKRKLRLPSKPMGSKIKIDPDLIRRIVENIFYNAVKHTSDGGRVTITLQVADQNGVRISISDNGEGIPEGELEQVFEKFGQAKSRQRGRKTDTGLGLTFCKLAAEAHGGKIELKSRVGEGTTFTICLPKCPPTDSA